MNTICANPRCLRTIGCAEALYATTRTGEALTYCSERCHREHQPTPVVALSEGERRVWSAAMDDGRKGGTG